jgi:transglutaminase-like putative cysteine protease
MTRRRELETLFLTMFAAVPLYLTAVIGWMPLAAFHLVMAGIFVRVGAGRGPELIPARWMRWLAVAYVPFYVLDAAFISRGAIAASTHLVLFIAVYQPTESMQRSNLGQRLVTTTLIFVASLATSTHITIILFVAAFAFLMFRQLIHISHLETIDSIELPASIEPPSSRSAGFYLAGAALIGSLLFPFLPRLRNPMVQGLGGPIQGASTALSETIDFSQARVTQNDGTVVARVWMDQETRPFFTPIRLRGTLYETWFGGKWRQVFRGARPLSGVDGTFVIARPSGIQRTAIVQQRPQRGRLFLPVGTFAVSGLTNLAEGPRDTFATFSDSALDLRVSMAFATEPRRLQRVALTGYPISPEVEAMARAIVGTEQRPLRQAQLIETYLSTRFRYVPNPDTVTHMTVDEFLLRTRAGHCEYFAAGMVVLMNSLGVPARIAGGFYGGRLNPLTGYYALRREDAHAWTEVWDGNHWQTFDSTPAALRPGIEKGGRLENYLSAISDSLTFFWDRYVLTFGLGDQILLFTDLLEWMRDRFAALQASARAQTRALLSRDFTMLFVSLAAAGILAVLVARRRRPLFDALASHLALHGIEVGPAMTLQEALETLRTRDPDLAAEYEPFVAMYDEERFSARQDRSRAAELRRKLAEM